MEVTIFKHPKYNIPKHLMILKFWADQSLDLVQDTHMILIQFVVLEGTQNVLNNKKKATFLLEWISS